MAKYILGISCYYHDSAAALIKDDEIVAAAQEERFTRIKNDRNFPENAVRYCLREAGIEAKDLHKIVFYEKPELKFKRVLSSGMNTLPGGLLFLARVVPGWLLEKLHWKKSLVAEFADRLGFEPSSNMIEAIEHHRSHAASAFFCTNHQDAAVLVVDGVGEFDTVSIWHGCDNKLEKLFQIRFPHSIGLLYSAFTYYTGFKINSGEYKVMGLAPYGEPKYVETIKKHLIRINDDGSFELNMEYFSFQTTKRMFNEKFAELLGGPARQKESDLAQREMDLARSIQEITNEVMLKLAGKAKQLTGSANLCMAGGVALNCVANGNILQTGMFKNLWIQPAAGDAGAALGAALSYHFEVENNTRALHPGRSDNIKGSLLGPAFSSSEVKKYLDKVNAVYEEINDPERYAETVAGILAEAKVVGWHQGRMEFGPRALGARSIIADPRNTEMQSVMNLKIKFRESFRPFAPSVLREDAAHYFDIQSESPYMLIVAPVKDSIRVNNKQDNLFGIEKLNVVRSTVPAITHVDFSARIQTVDTDANPVYYRLISKFKEKTGCSVLINSSFNVRGEPIVCTPEESYKCFMRTGMDVLAIENFILHKDKQPQFADSGNWREEFELD